MNSTRAVSVVRRGKAVAASSFGHGSDVGICAGRRLHGSRWTATAAGTSVRLRRQSVSLVASRPAILFAAGRRGIGDRVPGVACRWSSAREPPGRLRGGQPQCAGETTSPVCCCRRVAPSGASRRARIDEARQGDHLLAEPGGQRSGTNLHRRAANSARRHHRYGVQPCTLLSVARRSSTSPRSVGHRLADVRPVAA